MKSNKPTKQEFCLKIEIFKKKYPNKNITQYLADEYRVCNESICNWYKSFDMVVKNGRPTKEVK
jgi:hypothetical protein